MSAATFLLAAFSMLGAAIYLVKKTRGFISATSMLLSFLLLLYGPAYLVYMLYYNQDSPIYRELMKSPYFNEASASLNLAIAMTYLGCIIGIELIDRLAPRRAQKLTQTLQDWNANPLRSASSVDGWLIAVNATLIALMAWTSIREHHIAVISGFLETANSQSAKGEYRLLHAGSASYAYRVALTSIAPFLLTWGFLEGLIKRNWLLLATACVLFGLTLLGRLETLSKAPIALLAVQIGLATLLSFRNRNSVGLAVAALAAVILVFYPLIKLSIPEASRATSATEFFFWRTFFISNEVLLEFFCAVPYYISHTWGLNIRVVAILFNREFTPAYEQVSLLWRGQSGSTSNAMFIADAWADFSFLGVAVTSVLAGAICRMIDVIFVAEGKSPMTIGLLGCSFVGIVQLMLSSIQSAMLGGGLASIPLTLLALIKARDILRQRRKRWHANTHSETLSPNK
ncbi:MULTISPECIES: hypothetical protein [Bradyrhizobium]|uniref:Oligosaccharide repeat unit polymerase n=1 Tax=Bradyrhizobium barranii subsp. barranii TaxID=2823807 RepID=A0A7Z0Q3V4_9BRAD|nr:hypothetical protein [Bradyrhizobium barranii]UGX96559.1 hypothetical protein G6321_00016010 [Bradyrhizobium barranii subsp. barranii]